MFKLSSEKMFKSSLLLAHTYICTARTIIISRLIYLTHSKSVMDQWVFPFKSPVALLFSKCAQCVCVRLYLIVITAVYSLCCVSRLYCHLIFVFHFTQTFAFSVLIPQILLRAKIYAPADISHSLEVNQS